MRLPRAGSEINLVSGPRSPSMMLLWELFRMVTSGLKATRGVGVSVLLGGGDGPQLEKTKDVVKIASAARGLENLRIVFRD